MNNVSSIRDAKATDQQACEWVILLASGEASAEDRARCNAWLRAHPDHQTAFDQRKATWDRLYAMEDYVRTTDGVEPHPATRIGGFTGFRNGFWRRKRVGLTAAAAALVGFTVGGWLWYPFDSGAVYRTDVGERMTVTLADRSTVELNTDTELRVTYSDRVRNIVLRRGEAYFDVARDEKRPFVVKAGHGAITAVGTGFVVQVQNEAVQVMVMEGIVEVTHDVQAEAVASAAAGKVGGLAPPTLREGQRVEYDRRVGSPAEVDPKERSRKLAWRQGLLVFDDHTLDEVIQEVGRYTDTRLVIADRELQDLRIGGVFPAGDIEALLEFLEKGMNIHVNRNDPRVVYLTAPRPATIG